MPIFYQHDVDGDTRLAVWKIEEEEAFFLEAVPLRREITHPHKRLQHLAGRYLLQYLFPDFPLQLIRIADTRKPFLEEEAYHFSISHCGDYAAAIASRQQRVGIDIEVPSDKVVRIQHKFLHPEEHQLIANAGDITATTTLVWSAKEAMFKWWGLGGVDFSEMLRLKGDTSLQQHALEGSFINGSQRMDFPVHYSRFENLVLAWVHTKTNSE